MVKNELSIRTAESYRLASNVAKNKLNKFTEDTQKEISSVLTKIDFNSKADDNKLHNAICDHLYENALALKDENIFKAEETFFINYRKENLLAWSFVYLDRNNPDKEKIKAQIAHHREELVKIDNDIEKAKFNGNWFVKEYERDLAFKKEYSKLVNNLYNQNQRLDEQSYFEFEERTKEEYTKISQEFYQGFNDFYKILRNVIDEAYTQSANYDVKTKALSVGHEIINKHKEVIKLFDEFLSYQVDLEVLKDQRKEKLDVEEEINECNANMTRVSDAITKINEEIKKEKEELNSLCEKVKITNTITISTNTSSFDEKQKKVVEEVVKAYQTNDKDISRTLFNIVKDYVNEVCPAYPLYLQEKEKQYNDEVKKYRETVASTMSVEDKKEYENEEKYLFKLANIDNDSLKDVLLEIENKYSDRINEIEKEYQEDLQTIATNHQKRVEEYHQQKENAKILLKTADSKKATDLKEVVKLYKKEINAGDLDRKKDARANKNKKIKEAKDQYNLALANQTKPAPIALKYSYEIQVENDKALKAKEKSKLYKKLNKETHISRYHKNMNTQKRELLLGYLFLSIWAIGFILMTFVPMIYTVLLSCSHVTYTSEGYSKVISFSFTEGLRFPSWTGKENYENLFLVDVQFIYQYVPQFFRNLLLYLPIVVFISFVLALLLNTKIKGRTFFRIIYFLPVVIVSGPVLDMLNNSNSSGSSSIRLTLDGSSVATILSSISPKLLQYANEVFQNFIIILWMTGVPIVLFISALQKINRSLYEAADIDGANGWQKLWTITFPLIKSVLLICCLFTIMQVATINVSYVNPINSWIDSYISDMSKNKGMAALGAWVQTLIVLLFVLISFLLFREKEFVSKEKSYEEYEAMKKKKQLRKAKTAAFFHVNEVKSFFTKLFSPITKAINVNREKRKLKKELGGK